MAAKVKQEGFNPEFLTLLTNLSPAIYITLVWVNNDLLSPIAQQDKFIDYLLQHSPFRGVKPKSYGPLGLSHFYPHYDRRLYTLYVIKNETMHVQLAMTRDIAFPRCVSVIFCHPTKGELRFDWTSEHYLVLEGVYRQLHSVVDTLDYSTIPSMFFSTIYDLLEDFESRQTRLGFPPWNGPDLVKNKS